MKQMFRLALIKSINKNFIYKFINETFCPFQNFTNTTVLQLHKTFLQHRFITLIFTVQFGKYALFSIRHN